MAPTYVIGAAAFTEPVRSGARDVRSASSLSALAVPSGRRHAVDRLGQSACGAGTVIPFPDLSWGLGPERSDHCPYCLDMVPWVFPSN